MFQACVVVNVKTGGMFFENHTEWYGDIQDDNQERETER